VLAVVCGVCLFFGPASLEVLRQSLKRLPTGQSLATRKNDSADPRHAARQPANEALWKRVRSKQHIENFRSRTPSPPPRSPEPRSLSPVPGVMPREDVEALVKAHTMEDLRTIITNGGCTDDGCFNRSHLEQRAMQALGFRDGDARVFAA